MQLKQLVLSDIKIGMKKNIPKFIIAFLFSIVCCAFLYQRVEGKILLGELETGTGFYDFVLYIFGGIKKYTESSDNIFNMPLIWLAVHFIVSGCIYSYPVSNMYEKGNNMLLQYRSRKQWWITKNIWTIAQVIGVYVALYLGIIASTLLFGERGNTFSVEITQAIHGVVFNSVDGIAVWFIILPMIYSVMLALCQVNASLLVGPIYSMLIIVAYQVLSAYVQSWFLIGNYSMLLRQDLFVDNGVNPYVGIVLEIAVCCFSVILGCAFLKKKDII